MSAFYTKKKKIFFWQQEIGKTKIKQRQRLEDTKMFHQTINCETKYQLIFEVCFNYNSKKQQEKCKKNQKIEEKK